MKSIIIYYSYSGNTKRVVEVLKNHLAQKGAVDIIELTPLDESKSFFGQCARALKHGRAVISDVNCDLSGYDVICVGTPVWAFGPAPAVNAYIDKCQGTAGKTVVLFSTYGSGAGNQRCLDYIQAALTANGDSRFQRFSVQQGKVKDEGFVSGQIRGAIPP